MVVTTTNRAGKEVKYAYPTTSILVTTDVQRLFKKFAVNNDMKLREAVDAALLAYMSNKV